MVGLTRDPHQHALMAAAAKLGIATTDRAHLGIDAVDYHYRGRTERVLKGRVFSHLSAVASSLCDDKIACKRLLAAHGVPVPPGIVPAELGDTALERLFAAGGAWVAKPRVGTHGEGVILGLRTLEDLRRARFDAPPGPYLIEQQITGTDLRLQAVGGRLAAACRRLPASIVGDGHSILAEVIEARRAEVRRGNPANDLRLDNEVRAHLDAAGLTLDDVVPAGHRVKLRSVASMANGGRAIDLTDAVHPDWIELVRRIGTVIGIRVFAVDAITPDPTLPPSAGAVIEVNARPEWLHHTFSEGRQHDLARRLLTDLFEIQSAGGLECPELDPSAAIPDGGSAASIPAASSTTAGAGSPAPHRSAPHRPWRRSTQSAAAPRDSASPADASWPWPPRAGPRPG
jgi:D-alanine-D-alanine ligase-like ATP-grasp enzyme